MTYTVDVTEAHAYWNNTETVTINLRSDGTDGGDISVENAYRMVNNPWLSKQFDGLTLQNNQVMWLLPSDEVGTSNEVDRNVKITDSNAKVFRGNDVRRWGSGPSFSHWMVIATEVVS